MSMPLDLNLSLSASASSGAQSGDIGFGDFLVGGGKNELPVWIWWAAAAIVALLIWRKFK